MARGPAFCMFRASIQLPLCRVAAGFLLMTRRFLLRNSEVVGERGEVLGTVGGDDEGVL